MKHPLYVGELCVALLVALGACTDTGTGASTGAPPQGPYRLVVQGDESFRVPHGRQLISVAVVALEDFVVAEQSGAVSPSGDLSFSFSFSGLLAHGLPYQVHYWIDSNEGGGNVGVCDDPVNDHQWSVSVSTEADTTIPLSHDDANTAEVCSWF